MRIIVLCLSLLSLFSTFAISEENPFPMAVGNRWVYLHEKWDTGDKIVISTDTLIIAISDTIQLGGKKYYCFSGDPFFSLTSPSYYRLDGKTLYRRYSIPEGEIITYDFSPCGEGPGVTYSSTYYDCRYLYTLHNNISWERTSPVQIQLPLGLFEGYCFQFFDPLANFDSTKSRYIVPGLGLVRVTYAYGVDCYQCMYGDDYSLIRATIDGHDVVAGVQAANEGPTPFALLQNHPNPFNPVTTISYSLSTYSSVTIDVFNALGQQVQMRDLGIQTPGMHEFVFDGTGLPSGIYFYRVKAGEKGKVGKMMMMR
jgi:hypothetical protein